MKKNFKSYLLLIPLSGSVILLDQITKTIIRNNLAFGEVWSPWEWITPYARFVHWQNTGVVFGLFQGQSMFFAVLAAIIATAILYYYPRLSQDDWPLRVALGLQFGGAVGNLIDRLTIGHVTDFISVGNFAVFNIADASITCGVFIMFLGVWWQEVQEKKRKSDLDVEIENHTPRASDTSK